MNKDRLAEILKRHVAWLCGKPDGEFADLADADLTRADLADANLTRANFADANLTCANFTDANLTCANFTDADLTRANFTDANLTRANLTRANLTRANLTRANLTGTCLEPVISPYQWAISNSCPLRTIASRTLVLCSRTRVQLHMGGPAYELGRLYRAPVFSRDPVSSCHPGLYVAGGPESAIDGSEDLRMYVACWLDEMFIVRKCRVPRFYALATREDFDRVTVADMEGTA